MTACDTSGVSPRCARCTYPRLASRGLPAACSGRGMTLPRALRRRATSSASGIWRAAEMCVYFIYCYKLVQLVRNPADDSRPLTSEVR